MRKWRLMVTTLPAVVVVLVLKLAIEHWSGQPGWVDFGDVSAVLTAGAFLIGFMLAGTMADYKESEKMPSELATTLETIDDLIVVASRKSSFDVAAARRDTAAVAERVLEWLARRTPLVAVYRAVEAMNAHFQSMDETGGTAHANRAIVFLHAVRKTIGRMDVIIRTGFLASGYAILEVMVAAILLLLLASRFKTPVAEYTLIISISLIYLYMLRLIRNIDDPFDFDEDLEAKASAEVDLFPLLEYVARVKARDGQAQAALGASAPKS